MIAKAAMKRSKEEEGLLPQFRGSKFEYDPEFKSKHTGDRAGTFASTDPEEALHFGILNRKDKPLYFTKFPSLKESEVFDPTDSKAIANHLKTNPHVNALLSNPRTKAIFESASFEGQWPDVEDLIQKGFFDDLPEQYKAIRLRGEGDNYVYIGRRTPTVENSSTVVLPPRKHYPEFLADLANTLNAAGKRALDLGEVKELETKFNKIAGSINPDLEREIGLTLRSLKEGLPANYQTANLTSGNTPLEKATLQIISSVDTKEEAKQFFNKLILVPKATPNITHTSRRTNNITPKEITRLLDEEPDEGFNMKKFIEKHDLYNMLFPTVGAGALVNQDSSEVK